jgi:hypothetical protein
MIYLATQYSHSDPIVRKTRYLLAMEVAAELIKNKLCVYSPIVHCHEMAERHGFPTDAKFWEEYNNSFIRHCEYMIVLVTPELHTSKGVMAEIEFAKNCFIPIKFVDREGNMIEWTAPAMQMSY